MDAYEYCWNYVQILRHKECCMDEFVRSTKREFQILSIGSAVMSIACITMWAIFPDYWWLLALMLGVVQVVQSVYPSTQRARQIVPVTYALMDLRALNINVVHKWQELIRLNDEDAADGQMIDCTHEWEKAYQEIEDKYLPGEYLRTGKRMIKRVEKEWQMVLSLRFGARDEQDAQNGGKK